MMLAAAHLERPCFLLLSYGKIFQVVWLDQCSQGPQRVWLFLSALLLYRVRHVFQHAYVAFIFVLARVA